MSALTDLADELHANVIPTDDGGRIVTPDGGVIYCAFTGAIKLQRYGLPVLTLGVLTDGTEALADAYRAAVAAAVA